MQKCIFIYNYTSLYFIFDFAYILLPHPSGVAKKNRSYAE